MLLIEETFKSKVKMSTVQGSPVHLASQWHIPQHPAEGADWFLRSRAVQLRGKGTATALHPTSVKTGTHTTHKAQTDKAGRSAHTYSLPHTPYTSPSLTLHPSRFALSHARDSFPFAFPLSTAPVRIRARQLGRRGQPHSFELSRILRRALHSSK